MIGSVLFFLRYVFALENTLEPKKPLYADNGLGCGDFITWCFEEFIKIPKETI